MFRPLCFLSLALTASALPSSFADPDCLAKARALKTVTITNTVIDRGSPFNRENTTVTFHVANAAAGVSATCSASDVALTPNGIGSNPYKWYDCALDAAAGGTPDPRLGLVAKFQYDATLNFLTVNQTWVCGGEGSYVPPYRVTLAIMKKHQDTD